MASLFVIMAVVLSLLSNLEGSLVLGDIGTASSYNPPYLREWTMKNTFDLLDQYKTLFSQTGY